MKSKLYKTHRKASYYRLRRLGYFSVSLMIATILVVVPITLAQAGTTQSSSQQPSSSFPSSEPSSISEEVDSESSTEDNPQHDGGRSGTMFQYTN